MKPNRSKNYRHVAHTESTRSGPNAVKKNGSNRRLKQILPVAIFAIFAFLIARDQIPALDDWFEQIINPEKSQARKACEAAALSAAESAGHARIITRGQIHKTQAGYLIEKTVVGRMADDGTEVKFQFSCYTNHAGGIVKTHKFPPPE